MDDYAQNGQCFLIDLGSCFWVFPPWLVVLVLPVAMEFIFNYSHLMKVNNTYLVVKFDMCSLKYLLAFFFFSNFQEN